MKACVCCMWVCVCKHVCALSRERDHAAMLFSLSFSHTPSLVGRSIHLRLLRFLLTRVHTILRQERAKTLAALAGTHETGKPDVEVLKKVAQMQLQKDMKEWPVSTKAEEEETQRRIKAMKAADLHEERMRSDKGYRLRYNKMQKMKNTVMVAGVCGVVFAFIVYSVSFDVC